MTGAGEVERTWAPGMPEAYDRWLVPLLFAPYAEDAARRVAAWAPRRVLEVAAGTGAATARLVAAVGPAGEVVATDLNEPMVALGRARVPGARWEQADAQALPFDDGAFDAVVCQFGVMFFPDPVAALAEARRVTAPGGHLLVTAWGPLAGNDVDVALQQELAALLPERTPTFLVDVPHGYADRLRADATAAGWQDAAVERVRLSGRAGSPRDIARGLGLGGPLRAQLAEHGDPVALVDALGDRLERRLGTGPLTSHLLAHVLVAAR